MIQVLCYGDSNTWGYQPEKDGRYSWEQRYPGVLSKKLGTEYRVIENGLCGRTTCFDSKTEPYVNGVEEAKVCAMINEPIDIAVIMLGTNDCKDEYCAKAQVIGEGIEKIAETFEKTGAKIIVAAPPILSNLEKSPFYSEFGKGAEEKSKELAACYKRLASRHGWKFFFFFFVVGAGTFDKIHLDVEGHEKLAESVYKMIIGKEEYDE